MTRLWAILSRLFHPHRHPASSRPAPPDYTDRLRRDPDVRLLRKQEIDATRATRRTLRQYPEARPNRVEEAYLHRRLNGKGKPS